MGQIFQLVTSVSTIISTENESQTHRPEKKIRERRARKHSPYSKLNDRYGYFVAALVFLTAIPQASVPAVWWLLNSTFICLAGAWYILRHSMIKETRVLKISEYRTLLVILVIIPAIAIIQTLPIATFFPASLSYLPEGLEIVSSSVSINASITLIGTLRFLS